MFPRFVACGSSTVTTAVPQVHPPHRHPQVMACASAARRAAVALVVVVVFEVLVMPVAVAVRTEAEGVAAAAGACRLPTAAAEAGAWVCRRPAQGPGSTP
jgi:hypothetical protein